MLEFIIARYNYWIVIILMMVGLYIVFSRSNIIKTLIGLNLFQTSVFILYISTGKIAGGTAPILLGKYLVPTGGHGDKAHAGDDHAAEIDAAAAHVDGGQGTHAGPPPLTPADAADFVSGAAANALTPQTPGVSVDPQASQFENLPNLHTVPETVAPTTNDLFGGNAAGSLAPPPAMPAPPDLSAAPINGPDVSPAPPAGADWSEPMAEAMAALPPLALEQGAELGVLDIVYSNPLPHVLILTAIVVGVATTAVGLALAVRIREAYGTVEEDELERMDNAAAMGDAPGTERHP